MNAWFLVHGAMGFGAARLGVPLPAAMGGAVLYEIAENANRGAMRKAVFKAKGPETRADAVSDLLFFGLGYIAGRKP